MTSRNGNQLKLVQMQGFYWKGRECGTKTQLHSIESGNETRVLSKSKVIENPSLLLSSEHITCNFLCPDSMEYICERLSNIRH